MKLTQLKSILANNGILQFQTTDGKLVAPHFHLTEMGKIHKEFIDCGGTLRSEKTISLQLWVADDIDHRLSNEKFLKIIDLFEKRFGNEDLAIEVEFQGTTIEKYALDYNEGFVLVSTQTDCLAREECAVPQKTQAFASVLADTEGSCCSSDGCC